MTTRPNATDDSSTTDRRGSAAEDKPRYAPTKLPETEPVLPRKPAKPPKPRKVEKRQRGRKG